YVWRDLWDASKLAGDARGAGSGVARFGRWTVRSEPWTGAAPGARTAGSCRNRPRADVIGRRGAHGAQLRAAHEDTGWIRSETSAHLSTGPTPRLLGCEQPTLLPASPRTRQSVPRRGVGLFSERHAAVQLLRSQLHDGARSRNGWRARRSVHRGPSGRPGVSTNPTRAPRAGPLAGRTGSPGHSAGGGGQRGGRRQVLAREGPGRPGD